MKKEKNVIIKMLILIILLIIVVITEVESGEKYNNTNGTKSINSGVARWYFKATIRY